MMHIAWWCVGFPPIPVESAAVRPAPAVSPPAAATGGGGGGAPTAAPRVQPKPQFQKQSK